ncbi:MAG: hypothetical protein IKA23_09415, partial [Akkermansia sp.]|nr:hypothetical protein [Akkermansia sp.]
MKLHLPVKLFAAVVSLMVAPVVYGADSPMLDVIDEIISVETGTTQNFTPRTDATGYSYSIAKDGDGTLLFTGAGTNNATLYVREGLMQVGDGMTETSLTIRPGSYQKEGRYTGMGVSGKNAEVCFDKASADSNETAFFVGGLDGNGKMVIKNGSHVDFAGGNLFVIGDCSLEEATDADTGVIDMWNNITTAGVGAEKDTGNRYQGAYSTAQNGSGYTFGRGDVIVEGGSYFRPTYGNFWMSEGSLTVTDAGSLVEVALNGYGYRCWLGLGVNSTSTISVLKGGVMKVNASEFFSNYSDGSASVITVDGKDSTFTILDQTTVDGNAKDNSAYFGSYGRNSSASLKVSNGGEVNFENDTTYLGWSGSSSVGRSSRFEVGANSSLNATKLYMADGGTLDNSGTTTMEYISLSDGAVLDNKGMLKLVLDDDDAATYASLWVFKGAEVNNSGALASEDIYISNGVFNNTGTVKADYVSSFYSGTLNMSDAGGNIETGVFQVTWEGTASYELTGSAAAAGAPVTISDGGKIDLREDGTVELKFSTKYLTSVTTVDTQLKVAFVDGYMGNELNQIASSVVAGGLDSLVWYATDMALSMEESGLYITGVLHKKEVVDISGGEASNPITGDSTVYVTGESTISGDNTHTGGTAFADADVTLDSDSALGTGVVSNSGDTSLSTGTGVTVNLPDTIANSGNLSISGSYDGSSLDTIVVEDTRVCVDGKEGNNGFYREGGTAILVVDNKGNATLTVDDGTTVKSKDGDSLKLYASGLAAGELNYGNYHIEDGNHSAAMSEIQGMRPDSTADLTITMTNGELVADADATDVQ